MRRTGVVRGCRFERDMTPEEIARWILNRADRPSGSAQDLGIDGNCFERREIYRDHIDAYPSLKWPRAVDWRAPEIRKATDKLSSS